MIEPGPIEIRRVLHAPVHEVFRWWTEPSLLERWMSPVGSVVARVDLRVGGALSIVMEEGQVRIEHHGEFLEVDPPNRLVFTWTSQYTRGQSLVTVVLEPEGRESTRLLIVHRLLPADAAQSHAFGWGAMVERLERELVGQQIDIGGGC